MGDRDSITVLAEEVASALRPLAFAFSSPGFLRDFLEAEFGWDFPAAPSALDGLRSALERLFDLVAGSDEVLVEDKPASLDGVRAAFSAISDLRDAPGLQEDFRAEFPAQLVDYLLVEYLLGRRSRWGYLLLALGVVRLEEVPAAGNRKRYLRRSIAFDELGRLFDDPLAFVRAAHRWGRSDFAGERLANDLAGMLTGWGLQVRQGWLDEQTFAHLNSDALRPEETLDTTVRLHLIAGRRDNEDFSTGVELFLLPETTAAKPGFALLPCAPAEFEGEVAISDALRLTIGSSVGVGGVAVLLRPGHEIELRVGLDSESPSFVSGTVTIAVRLANPGPPVLVLGSPDGSRLELSGVSTTGGARVRSNGEIEVFAEFAVVGGRIVIRPAQGIVDGFLTQLLPTGGIEIDADPVAGISTAAGVYFRGSGGLELSLPTHLQLGSIEIQSALLRARSVGDQLPIEFAATIRTDLAAVKAVVENIGAQAIFTFPSDRNGSLGPVDLTLDFLPPKGVELSIDTGLIAGSGYLFFDSGRGEYAGALELELFGEVTVEAIGLISTMTPDGSTGFSLLIVMSVEFGTGIQLGFGFTLLAVGGLVGLNRTMNLQALSEGIRSGAIDSVMFPRDIVANASKFISDLRTFFPAREDRFLIGPMVKLGWGTPTLVNASVGIIIEIPPGNIAIVGVLQVALPTTDAALIKLQVGFVGVVESDRKRIWFFAALFDSRVLFLTIDGEMGVLMAFGDDANFVVTVGGFHPRFAPPPLPFPSPRRVAISLLSSAVARVRIEGYFAVTSNTVQFGARVEVFFGLDELNVQGHLAFDALFQFSPFYFVIEISASFSVKALGVGLFSVRLRGELEGPAPWHIVGHGEISLLFFDIDVDFETTWGEDRKEVLPPIALLPILVNELGKVQNWRAELPAGVNLGVTIRSMPEPEATLLLHPVGVLHVSQRAMPLDLELDKFGTQKPSDVKRLSVVVTGGGLAVKSEAYEQFARAQFQDSSDKDKLSFPAFEGFAAGFFASAEGENAPSSTMVRRVVRYEEVILDSNYQRFRHRFQLILGSLFAFFLGGAAAALCELSKSTKQKLQPFDDRIEIRPDRFSVVLQTNNKAFTTESVGFPSAAQARDYMNRQIAVDASLIEGLHVIPDVERAA
ncbi:DUF6603 domain-containing protein [Nocardia abscessus]|uniref:DUF6603 domain-containing protein n=1 Tax=Nocardia abscessus TaxID=120957 RepID=UPI002458B40B|nr:DUF6603 domain-containing protein [Nocardia abscessus]